MSGVHRKDVRRFPGADAGARERARAGLARESVVGRWLGDPAYRDADGRPAVLARTGDAPSFEALVAGISTDVRPRTVLDELKRLGFVVHDETADSVRLDTAAFVPSADDAHLLRLFEANLADHASAAAAKRDRHRRPVPGARGLLHPPAGECGGRAPQARPRGQPGAVGKAERPGAGAPDGRGRRGRSRAAALALRRLFLSRGDARRRGRRRRRQGDAAQARPPKRPRPAIGG
ncbi:MAG: DUF6502 family protein [Xanthomonadales bacterium]|nr:DUF6502 family protein [Xanthomonadales bacterium]